MMSSGWLGLAALAGAIVAVGVLALLSLAEPRHQSRW
jgi:hypothetical protein